MIQNFFVFLLLFFSPFHIYSQSDSAECIQDSVQINNLSSCSGIEFSNIFKVVRIRKALYYRENSTNSNSYDLVIQAKLENKSSLTLNNFRYQILPNTVRYSYSKNKLPILQSIIKCNPSSNRITTNESILLTIIESSNYHQRFMPELRDTLLSTKLKSTNPIIDSFLITNCLLNVNIEFDYYKNDQKVHFNNIVQFVPKKLLVWNMEFLEYEASPNPYSSFCNIKILE